MTTEHRKPLNQRDLNELRAAVEEADMAQRIARGPGRAVALSRFIALSRALEALRTNAR